ncbi:DUF4871 domain-containing protein [Metabacillus rhizolycopersici]|uniref:DUF4871 domain-containing protein n=1 Tax=Metabacillus rhizolycopersici TaxID=2875709 RepID=A0ABS7UX98_9BACI|nr:DUF4871 domain-containing protein [Metabacillus rhizolycopersici]MBZ5752612.1 DUF4871 domain-containing protein [Metabacillus rhizolycopersici]
MRKALCSIFLLVILLIVGCSQDNKENANVNTTNASSVSEENQQWDLSPEFETSTGDKLVGQEGKVGIIGGEFKAGDINKWLWHFWGDEKTIKSGNFKVVAVNKDTGEKEKVLVTDAGTANERKVWNYGELDYSPNGIKGSDSSRPSNLSFPKAGIWRLEVFIGAERFGTIVIDVK